jgi:hypothetical protein
MYKKRSNRILGAALAATLLTVSTVSTAADQHLYIPEDTLFYLGTERPLAVEHLFALMPDVAALRRNADIDSDDAVLSELANWFEDPVASLADWGIEDQVSFNAYSVGLSPVLRISLTDADKFVNALDQYERRRQITATTMEAEGWTIRQYSPDSGRDSETDETETEADASVTDSDTTTAAAANGTASATMAAAEGTQSQNVEAKSDAQGAAGANVDEESARPASTARLVVGVNDKDAVFSLVGEAADITTIHNVLGINKPDPAIVASDKLGKLRKQWGYGEELAAFIDFEKIAAVVTDDTNTAGQQLLASSLLDDRMRNYIEQMRSEPCRAEAAQLVSNWPMMVGGYRKLEVDDKKVDFDTHMAMVIGHEKLKDTLKLFGGLLPSSQSSSKPMLSVGLGLTVDNMAQALGQLNEMLASVNYQCQPLYPLNALARSDLSAMSMGVVMFGGMARGVRGLSLNVFDADINPQDRFSAVKSIDTAIAISADNPAMLVGTLKMLPQFGALGELPLDGSEIDVTSSFPLPVPPGVQIKAAVKGNNIVLFAGEKSTDFANRLAQNEAEGFFRIKANTRLILDKITASMQGIDETETTQQISDILDQYLSGELSYSMEFTDNGVEMVNKGLVDRRDTASAE